MGRSGRMKAPIKVPQDFTRSESGLVAMLDTLPLCVCTRAPQERTSEDPDAVALSADGAMAELEDYLGEPPISARPEASNAGGEQ